MMVFVSAARLTRRSIMILISTPKIIAFTSSIYKSFHNNNIYMTKKLVSKRPHVFDFLILEKGTNFLKKYTNQINVVEL